MLAAESSFDRFRDHLRSMVGTMERLEALARQKRERIAARDGAGLVKVLEEEAELAEALARAEERRQAMAEELGLAGVPFEQWREAVPPAAWLALEGIGRRLRELTRALAAHQAAIDGLVQQQLAYVQFALSALTGPQAADYVYGPPAAGDGGAGAAPGRPGAATTERSLFDLKA